MNEIICWRQIQRFKKKKCQWAARLLFQHIMGQRQTNRPDGVLERQSHYVGSVSFIHSLIHSFIHPRIHSSPCFLSLPAVVYSVEPERQAAGYWVISAFLSRLSTPYESPQLQEKETKVTFAFMSLRLQRAHAGVFARWGLAATRTWAATAVTFRGWEQTSAWHLQFNTTGENSKEKSAHGVDSVVFCSE